MVIETKDKMATILQMVLQLNFLEWKSAYLDSNFIEVCSWGSIWQ